LQELHPLINNTYANGLAYDIIRKSPYMDHLFIDKINGVNVIIPSESLFNVCLSKRLGFHIIEGNVHQTSDGQHIVMHGDSGKFGQQVEHIDGQTDISNIAINTVTLDWIKENVRYKSIYAKYRVSPPSLEEWLYCVKRNDLIPYVQHVGSSLAIADAIMGKNNYISYGSTSRMQTSATICEFVGLSTKEAIIARCREIGRPYIYSMSNPTAFTDEQLKDIVDTLHSEGYLIGFAGCYNSENQNQRLLSLGFDFSGSGWQIPEFFNGNICNLDGNFNFSDFSTQGTVENGILTLVEGQTVAPATSIPQCFVGGGCLTIRFSGTIQFVFGNYINESFTSGGEKQLTFTTYFLDSVPTFSISASENTDIFELSYRASEF
jgi:hypothetical protein